MAALQSLRQIVKSVKFSPRFERHAQHLKVISCDKGYIKCEMPVLEEHLNMKDGMHGGFTATLLDIVSTYAIATIPPARFGVSVNLNVSYIKAAQKGDNLTITSKVMKSGKTLAFANIEIKNQKDELIAFGQHTKFVANG